MIDIEVDGDQHYLDDRIVESDKRRNKYLKDLGWSIVRIKWSDYQKLNKNEKKKYIRDLVSYINGLIKSKPEIKLKKSSRKNFCKCGNEKHKRATSCIKCASLKRRKVERPPYEQLMKEIVETNYSAVGRKYGVSDNTIRKWKKNYEKNMRQYPQLANGPDF